MTLLTFLAAFGLLLLIGPVIMVGWWAITRGRIEYTASGGAFRTGKLFNGWHFFWTRHTTATALLQGPSLETALLKLNREFSTELVLDGESACFHDPLGRVDYNGDYRVRAACGAELVHFTERSGRQFWQLMGVELTYRFPEWVRDPVASCPTCFASVYGSLLYWTTVGVAGINTVFAWSSIPWFSALASWVCYCVGCAAGNTYLSKKL
jgi:hypothetical protein